MLSRSISWRKRMNVTSAARDWLITCCPSVVIGRPPVARWPWLAGTNSTKQPLREEQMHQSTQSELTIYRVSQNNCQIFGQINWTKLNRKVIYHFAIFTIVNIKISTIKNCWTLVFNNFLLKYYQFYRKIAINKNYLFSFHRTLRIFSKFFINFLVLHFLIFINMRKYGIKKFWKNS